MKKTTIALAVAASIFGAGCAEPVSNDVKVTTKPQNILIAYYSYSGNTKFAAELIQKQTGGDLFEIVPETPYPSDYDACVSQARDEIRSGFKPQLKTQVENFDQYIPFSLVRRTGGVPWLRRCIHLLPDMTSRAKR